MVFFYDRKVNVEIVTAYQVPDIRQRNFKTKTIKMHKYNDTTTVLSHDDFEMCEF